MNNLEIILLLGVIAAAFVGVNIGGSSTGVAFGPSVGSKLVSKPGAAALMTFFALIGGWTVGRNVIETMGGKIVPASQFSLTASVIILFFIGLSLLISNLSGVPASTSMTAVGAIAGLGIATGSLNWEVMGRILSWWLVAPAFAFLAGGIIGRYIYVHLDDFFKIKQSHGSLIELNLSEGKIGLGPGTTKKEVFSSLLVLSIACYMAFSAGASNVANAVAPLVGSKVIQMNAGIILAVAAMSLGGFTIARKTLDTVGDGITDLPLLAALVVSVVSASIISFLSFMGIPASLAINATMCITGLGWGRASRTLKAKEVVMGGEKPPLKTSALNEVEKKKIGEEDQNDLPDDRLFKPEIIGHVVTFWILTPLISAGLSYIVFSII
ncbi:MAG: inorganic phosphate transporter [Nanohaloarchaea archaeon]|nr:inorganic phosphate transporter [Candidatus Nanohaloarchaea archaeon]